MLRRACLIAASVTVALTAPLAAQPDRSAMPTPRTLSGSPRPDADLTADAAEVRLTYDDLADPHPPAGVPVTLVGYRADDTVAVTTVKTDRTGRARFTTLDTSGRTAYYALAALPRAGRADRLSSTPIVPDGTQGTTVVLSALARRDSSAPVDELADREAQAKAAATARGVVRVHIAGVTGVATEVVVRDAATGKPVARAPVTSDEALVPVPARAGQVLYAEASLTGGVARTLPFVTVADRGAAITAFVYPKLLPSLVFTGAADDDALTVRMELQVFRGAWIPYADGATGPSFPLPRGAAHIELGPDSGGDAIVDHGAVRFRRPLPPGTASLAVSFELPVDRGQAAWSLDLPSGIYQGSIVLEDEPGLSIDQVAPANAGKARSAADRRMIGLDDVSLPPGNALALTVHVPQPGPANALPRACRGLAPDASPMIGQTVDFTLPRIDGGAVKLSALRGHAVLVNFMASWDMLSSTERPTLARLAGAVRGLKVVMVASDSDPHVVATTVGKLPFPVAIDTPAGPDHPIGAITGSWSIEKLPETVLVDRHGVARFHFRNARDWDKPEARRCIAALTAAR
ncbi:MAG: TlpA family protein disulfide reductase [Deltaproteobacteria bacterium]|nr:TlpA family protein disulfide reductase [Deltaproteobacteria bacterium]